MFKGFDVKLDAAKFRQKVAKQGTELWDIFVRKGKASRKELRDAIGAKIASGKWVLSGSDIESNWFPKLMNHVFISHSHQDEDLALALAGALRHWMKLDAFVDSSVWGYYADLQKLIYQKVTSLRGEVYGTQRTELENSIVSHVHCMLTKSLVQMMDQCECLIFLNTPSSIGIRNGIRLSPQRREEALHSETMSLSPPSLNSPTPARRLSATLSEQTFISMLERAGTR